MSKIMIAGIGNVLLGDDGVGPFFIKVLESQYDFQDNVELADLGTPGLDLPVHLADAEAVILVDSAKFDGEAGSIRLYRKQDILRNASCTRIDCHSPALVESIALARLMGTLPPDLLMIGIQGSRFEPGSPLSRPVRECIPHITDAVRRELYRLNVWCEPKVSAAAPRIWWDRIKNVA